MGDLKSNSELPEYFEPMDLESNPKLPFPGGLGADAFDPSCDVCPDEYGTATETKAMEENCFPKEICDSFDEFGRTSSLQRIKWSILDKWLSEYRTEHFFLPVAGYWSDNAFKAAEVWLKAGLTRDLKWGVPVPQGKYKDKVCHNTPRVHGTDHLFLEHPKREDATEDPTLGFINKMPIADYQSCNAFKATEVGLKAGRAWGLEWGVPVPYEKYKDEVFNDCFDAPSECVLMIECCNPDWKIDSANPSPSPSLTSWAPGNEITFTKADLPQDSQNHIGALYVTVESRDVVLSRVIVDNGTGINVMPLTTFIMLGYDQEEDLSPCRLTVEGYDKSSRKPLGEVMANLKLGMLASEVVFVVMDISVSYNLLLGRPWLHDLRAVPSTLHQKVKLPFKMGDQDGILTIEGDR